jgi:peptidoglycan hydrolase-like protein with peptidoglycan-binding domain
MKRKLLVAGGVLVILAGVIAGSVLVSGAATQQPEATPALPPATAEVIRTTLIETRTVPGTLGYGEPAPIGANGDGTLTWLAPIGSTVARGEPLFKIDERPVVALYGSVPMYRALEDGVEGEPAAEGEAAEGTIEAVDVEAGTVDVLLPTGEVLTLSGAAHATIVVDGEHILDGEPATLDDLVVGADVTVTFEAETMEAISIEMETEPVAPEEGETPANPVSGSDVRQLKENLAELGYTGLTLDETFDSATAEAVRTWQADLGLPETGTVQPGQVVFTPGAVRIAEHTARVGDVVGERGSPVLSYTGTDRLVTVELRVADLALAAEGREVTVTVPGVGAIEGEIAQVGTLVRDDTVEVTVAISEQEALGSLDAAPVDVDFVSEEREDVLAVPVAALLALAEGGFGVEVVEGGTTRIVAVRTGMFARGLVEVTGEGIAEGVRVGVPR